MEELGYPIKEDILYQDNKSAILLEKWLKECRKTISSDKCLIFFISDQVNRGNIKMIYCPTDEMIGDFMTKPLQGIKFSKFREAIMGN